MSDTFKVGDVIENHWAGLNNRYHIVVGRRNIKTGKYSTMSVYKTRMLLFDKMSDRIHYLAVGDPKHTRIGHIDYKGWLLDELNKVIVNREEK